MIRKIHLDFHTHPDTANVGAAFDAEQFASTLADAHVNYLATPGKCQYGLTYFDTKTGRPHPHLVAPELFPDTVKACVDRGIKVQAYYTLGIDDALVNVRPELQQRFKDGSGAHWGTKLVCYATPYVDDVVIPEVIETIERCPGICGFWFDICLYIDGAFYSESFERVARERLGQKADDEYERWLLGRTIIRDCCRRVDAAVIEHLPHAENYYNSLVVPGEPENLLMQPMHEVENPVLFGSCEGIPTSTRWFRHRGQPVIGLVSRFMSPWMDPGTLRTVDQIRFDVGRVVSLGSPISMGDHRHPDGTLDRETYRRVGEVYSDVENSENWLDGVTPCREAVLLSSIERGSPHLMPGLPKLAMQATRMLEEIGLQFDIALVEDELPESKLLIWPEETPVNAGMLAQIRRHVEAGGALLAMAPVVADGVEFPADLFGVKLTGEASDENPWFLRTDASLGVSEFEQVMSCGSPSVEAVAGVEVLGYRLGMASMSPPCPGRELIGPAIVRNGNVIYCAAALVSENAGSATPMPREVLRALCDRLLVRRMVRHSAGTSVAAQLHRSEPGYTLHLLHWAMERWDKQPNPVAEFPGLGPIEVELVAPERVTSVRLVPSGEELDFTWADGVCRFGVRGMKVWQMVGLRTGGR